MTTKCLYCKKIIVDKPSHIDRRKYCSIKCRYSSDEFKAEIIKCPVCKIDFRRVDKYGQGRIYCSNKCHAKAKSLISTMQFTCLNCKKQFSRIKWQVTQSKGRYCSLDCWRYSNELQEQGARGIVKQSHKKGGTNLEKIVYDYLILKGIVFEKQKIIGKKLVVDAYIPSLNLVIEADGRYWHSFPKSKARDIRKNTKLQELGYKVLRLPEEYIKNHKFEEAIINAGN